MDPMDRNQSLCDAAIARIGERLADLAQLACVVHLTLCEVKKFDTPLRSLIIDSRSQERAALLTLEGDCQSADVHVKTDPAIITRLCDGRADIRSVIIDSSRFRTEGREELAVRFGDILSGTIVVHPIPVTELDGLPTATTDLEQVKRDVAKWGYGFVKDALTPAMLARLQARTAEQAQAERERDFAVRDGGPTLPNQRIYNLVSKGQEYIDLLDHPLIDAIVPDILNDDFLLYSYSVNIANPGSKAMVIHSDQVAFQPPIRQFPLGLNVMWFLTDVSDANGGTRVFPGSHLPEVAPPDLRDVSQTVSASGPAGTAMVFESRLWHATGRNTSIEGSRPVILSFFVRSFLRTQENWFLQVPPEVEASLSERVRGFLGYRCSKGLGQVAGGVESKGRPTAPGALAVRPKQFVGVLRVPEN